MVFLGLTTSWSFATAPTRMSPFSPRATTVGRIRLPLSVGTTRGIRLRTWATHALVVPRSMPTMGFSRFAAMSPGSLARIRGASERDVLVFPVLEGAGGRRDRLPEERRDGPRVPQRGRRGRRGRERRRRAGLVELPALQEFRLPRQLLQEARRLEHHPLAIARRGHHRIGEVQLVL